MTLRATAKTLREAAALMLDGGWCREAFARDARGRAVEPTDLRACRWCALGSVMRIRDTLRVPADITAAALPFMEEDVESIAYLNDSGTAEDIATFFLFLAAALETRARRKAGA